MKPFGAVVAVALHEICGFVPAAAASGLLRLQQGRSPEQLPDKYVPDIRIRFRIRIRTGGLLWAGPSTVVAVCLLLQPRAF